MRAVFAIAAVFALLAAASSAPGDRYFGRLNMSALRVRYETMQLKKRYETHKLLPEDTQHLLLFTEDAYRQWARLYPHDPWLPSTGFLIAQLYAELPGGTARDRAVALFVYVSSHFPKSPYAKRSSAQLHRGVPTRPYPAWASALKTPVPSPSPILPAPATPSTEPFASPTGVRPSAAPTVSPNDRVRLSHHSDLNRLGLSHRERPDAHRDGDYRS